MLDSDSSIVFDCYAISFHVHLLFSPLFHFPHSPLFLLPLLASPPPVSLQSEPKEYACNGLGQKVTAASGTTLAAGMLLTLVSVVYAAFRAGSNTRLFTLDGSLDAGDMAPEVRRGGGGEGREGGT